MAWSFQGAICLPLAWPYVAVIMGLWLVLFSERPSSTSRVVRQQIEKTVFKLFNLYYIIFGVGGGGGGIKKLSRDHEGGWTNSPFANGGALHNNFPFEAHFSAPLLMIIAQSLTRQWLRGVFCSDWTATFLTTLNESPILLPLHKIDTCALQIEMLLLFLSC